MFTGIVEELGEVLSLTKGELSSFIHIKCTKILKDIHIGDSISVNGVCLTVYEFDSNGFKADIMNETFNRTSLSLLKPKNKVNLESAMILNGRFGGHIVTGHIDGTGEIISKSISGNSTKIGIKSSPNILRLIIEKGSITIDGISLTVTDITKDAFYVSIVPHTLRETNLYSKGSGDIVNLENDIIGKYIEKFISSSNINTKSNITLDFLSKNGF